MPKDPKITKESCKYRLDLYLVEKGFCSTRKKAQALILAGKVLVNDEPLTKAGSLVTSEMRVRIKEKEHPYVSRGALKLVEALKVFKVDVQGKVAMDIGSSTGGFCQVLLEAGVKRVFAIDVGTNQMDYILRKDPRIILLEGTNVRYLDFEVINCTVDFICVDVSFISLEKVIPNIVKFSTLETDWITLIKPQFEAGPDKVEKGGIIKNDVVRGEVVQRTIKSIEKIGFKNIGLIESPTKGTKGNSEFLAHFKRQ